MDQLEEVATELIQVKGDPSIILKKKCESQDAKDAKLVLTTSDEISLKEWLDALNLTYHTSKELLGSMAKKATKIYGTDYRSMATGINTQPSSPRQVSKSLSRQNSTPVLNVNRATNN